MDIILSIQNWEKYNPRSDRNASIWFRMEKSILTSQDLFGLTASQKWVWVGIMCMACNAQGKKFGINPNWLAHESGANVEDVEIAIKHLESREIAIVEWPPCHQLVSSGVGPSPSPTVTVESGALRTNVRTYEQTDVTNERTVPAKTKRHQPTPVQAELIPIGADIVSHYCDTWKSRYGTNPTILGADGKRLKSFAQTVGLPRARLLIQAFLDMNDSWFLTKRHDVATLIGSMNAVTQFLDTGQTLTKSDIKNAEVLSTNEKTLRAIREGGV